MIDGAPAGTMDPPNALSFLTLGWLNSMMLRGAKKPLSYEDLPGLRKQNKAQTLQSVITPWREQLKSALEQQTPTEDAVKDAKTIKVKSSLLGCIFREFWHQLVFGIFLDTFSTAVSLVMPIVLGAIINSMNGIPDPNITFTTSGIGLALLLFSLALVRIFSKQISAQWLRNYQVNVATVLTGAVFEKSLKLSNRSSKSFSEGRVLQMINTDVRQVAMMVSTGYKPFITAGEVVFTIFLLVRLVGSAVSAAAMTMAAALVLSIPIVAGITKYQNDFFTAGDRRLKLFREIMQAIKIIKFRGSEDEHGESIITVRKQQLKALLGMSIGLSFLAAILTIAPLAMPTATFVVYSQGHAGQLDPAIIFPTATYFTQLFIPLYELPQTLMSLIIGLISLGRIKVFLNCEERSSVTGNDDSENSIMFEKATLRWEEIRKDASAVDGTVNIEFVGDDDKEKASIEKVSTFNSSDSSTLFRDFNLKVAKHKLTAVVGPVGSGKSSLFSACTGGMTQVSGQVFVNGSVALCEQQPWLLSTTVKQNILFNKQADRARLDAVVKACALDRDLSEMESGIETEIGEKGIALSGGQKSRVALARAVYSDADIFLMDDPLAALDAHVGKHIFEECIRDYLAGKTRVLITHHLHVLSQCDQVIVMHDGHAVECGTYEELIAKNGVLSGMMKNYKIDDDRKTGNGAAGESKLFIDDGGADAVKSGKGLIAVEEREKGAVKFSVIKSYWHRSGGPVAVFFLFFSLLGVVGFQAATYIWLAIWTQQNVLGYTNSDYLHVYVGTSAAVALTTVVHANMLIICGYVAAKNFHNAAVRRLMRAPMSWYDGQPIGRIVNRLSGDLEKLDQDLPNKFLTIYFNIAYLVCNLISIAYSSPWILILFAFLSVIFYFILQLYRSSIREVRRLSSITLSPLVSHISESLGGISTIRAFGCTEDIISKQRALIDVANVPQLIEISITIWLNLRVEILSSLITFAIAIIGVETNNITPALVGLALSQASDFTLAIGSTVSAFAQTEASLVSVERLDEYAQKLPVEAAATTATDPALSEWPSKGSIEIEGLVIKYQSRDEPVLSGINVSIRGGEKIGVVGRTGSGKSSLLTALFRIVEPHGGRITIDEIDITRLGLKTLRNRMQIIPQDPILFSGTIRSNLDAQSVFTDVDLWTALGLVGMKDYVMELPQRLETAIEEGGSNLSVGQRQLLILARAICHRPRILVLDEASSAIDVAADELIQRAIQTEFKEATVISVAHRLNTVASFDRIVVLDAGRVVEFDSPSKLLRHEGGVFRGLVEATGNANAELIREIADGHEGHKAANNE